MKTEIVNCKTDYYEVYIGQKMGFKLEHSGYYGNPYTLGDYSRKESIFLYRIYFNYRIKTDIVFRNRILKLKGKRLGCFCKPEKCHGDIIKEYLEGLP